MNNEAEWHAHYRCTYCHAIKAKADIIYYDDKPICRMGECKEKYYTATHPKPVAKGE